MVKTWGIQSGTDSGCKLVAVDILSGLCAESGRVRATGGYLDWPADLFDDPHLNQGGHMLDMQFANGKRANIPGLPLEMGGHDLSVRSQTPRNGEHTREVLADLGYDTAQIDAWIDGGIASSSDKS